MSINSDSSRLNPSGQAVLGGISSIVVNGIAHPLSTIQSRGMVTHLSGRITSIAQLYRGYVAICGTEAVGFSMAFIAHNALRGHCSDLNAAILTGAIISPAIGFGEGLTRNRQVNPLPYREIFARAVRPAGLGATAMREIPFTVAVFYLSPLLERHLSQNSSSGVLEQAVAGITSSTIAGFATTPFDLIKTRVQTHDSSLTMRYVVQEIAKEGYRGFFRCGMLRSGYVGLAGACMHLVNHSIPSYLPESLQAKE